MYNVCTSSFSTLGNGEASELLEVKKARSESDTGRQHNRKLVLLTIW